MQSDDAQRYCSLMAEIKVRLGLVKDVGGCRVAAFPRGARVEFVYLQLRKTIELIAMGSLVANAKILADIHLNIQKFWKAKDLMEKIEAINPNFYPKPIIQKPTGRARPKMEWLDRPDDFLTKDRFISLCDKCGSALHAGNPLAPEQNFVRLEEDARKWYLWIINLLNAHVIQLVDTETLWLIQMAEDAQRPTCTIFARSEAGHRIA